MDGCVRSWDDEPDVQLDVNARNGRQVVSSCVNQMLNLDGMELGDLYGWELVRMMDVQVIMAFEQYEYEYLVGMDDTQIPLARLDYMILLATILIVPCGLVDCVFGVSASENAQWP